MSISGMHPSYDETGDIIMFDVEDESVVQAINVDLTKLRSNAQVSRTPGSFEHLQQALPAKVLGVFVIDTNFIISHLSIVKGLVDAYSTSHMLVLIPWVVIQELDGLKNASRDYGQANLATLSRQAIRYIFDCLSSGNTGLRGQKRGESLFGSEGTERGDDAILDCGQYWHEKLSIPPTLLSNDRNLCNKFIIHAMTCGSHESGTTAASLLWKFGTGVSHPPDSPPQDLMDIDDMDKSPAHHLHQQHMERSNENVWQQEMQTDACIAPLYKPTRNSEDPFAELAAKAGASPYEHTSRPLPLKGMPSPSTSPSPRRKRSQSPQTVRIPMTLPSSPPSPASLVALFQDISSTIISAFPQLIASHLRREMDDPMVSFLLPYTYETVVDVTKVILDNWLVCFSSLFSTPKATASVKDSFRKYSQLLQNSHASSRDASATVTFWIETWRKLSDDIGEDKYKRRREARIGSWQSVLGPERA